VGEATYYLKARYPNDALALEGAAQLRYMVREGATASAFWQKHRNDKDQAAFWKEFGEKFPMVSDYLKNDVGHSRYGDGPAWGCDIGNGLAGILDFGWGDHWLNVAADGSAVMFHAEVWHFADWGPFCAWVERVTGATKAAHLSDEYVASAMWRGGRDYFELLEV